MDITREAVTTDAVNEANEANEAEGTARDTKMEKKEEVVIGTHNASTETDRLGFL